MPTTQAQCVPSFPKRCRLPALHLRARSIKLMFLVPWIYYAPCEPTAKRSTANLAEHTPLLPLADVRYLCERRRMAV
jgi:hypothetical protein